MSINYDNKWGATGLKCWSRREIWSNYQSWVCTEIQCGGKTCWQLEAGMQILWDCFASLCLLIRHFLLKNGAIAVHQREYCYRLCLGVCIIFDTTLKSLSLWILQIIISFFFYKMYAMELNLLPGKGFQVIFHFKWKGKHFIFRTDCNWLFSTKLSEYSCRYSMRWHYIKKKKRKGKLGI